MTRITIEVQQVAGAAASHECEWREAVWLTSSAKFRSIAAAKAEAERLSREYFVPTRVLNRSRLVIAQYVALPAWRVEQLDAMAASVRKEAVQALSAAVQAVEAIDKASDHGKALDIVARTEAATIPPSVAASVAHYVARLAEVLRVLNEHARVYGERSHHLSEAIREVAPIVAAYKAKLAGGQRVANGKGLGEPMRALIAQAPDFTRYGI